MARVPRKFVNEVLWPEFQELNRTLASYLEQVTDRVIAQDIDADTAEVELVMEQLPLPDGIAQNLHQS